mmetsp:Transcript_24064/g.55232  ORF Transcript_24064/g.55232 Transcript_24064/m.55232 type:complete len:266 (-) Transcript_24064:7-804(-)
MAAFFCCRPHDLLLQLLFLEVRIFHSAFAFALSVGHFALLLCGILLCELLQISLVGLDLFCELTPRIFVEFHRVLQGFLLLFKRLLFRHNLKHSKMAVAAFWCRFICKLDNLLFFRKIGVFQALPVNHEQDVAFISKGSSRFRIRGASVLQFGILNGAVSHQIHVKAPTSIVVRQNHIVLVGIQWRQFIQLERSILLQGRFRFVAFLHFEVLRKFLAMMTPNPIFQPFIVFSVIHAIVDRPLMAITTQFQVQLELHRHLHGATNR